ncbi:hypothetical protein DL766_006818 [Monosporascus sp. MC13-8B]|uniref:Uncharacterized protein n=1 Tax=Monosporascus cannonballus TaxID=155416 RepID=A0ABY0H3X9_9PEZI|nr:hypothetical protein DL762_006168 [Monosporascus cannonballus]RYO90975.1 hypothetical protein DL763_005146 [Monosporascus cannonballus]RYP26145.1 hypothetical protein DL766_006818 [Monosporascus sp. MC13-8B]
MKTFGPAFAALLAAALAAAQSLPPSPTASVGCEPHGDHWHCDGPASVTAVDTVTSTSVVATASDRHDHEEGTESLAPSPTESVGCEPHGDHWHCEGPASATTDAPAASTTPDHDDEDHDHASGTGSLAPSPTESVGCEPHGDHWHCDGPAETATESDEPSPSPTDDAPVETAAAGELVLNKAALAGGLLAAIRLAL